MKKKIVLIGGNGVVGTSIYQNLNSKFTIEKCNRNDNFEKFVDDFDTVIHTANSSKKYEAVKNPEKDFKESVLKTKKIALTFRNKKIILISTISARIENNIYGINRKESEDIILNANKNNYIVRLPVIYSSLHNRGILFDLLNSNKIFLDKKSKLNPIHIDQFSQYLSKNISNKGIIEFGSAQDIELGELIKILSSKSIANGEKIDLITSKKVKYLPNINLFLTKLIEIKSYLNKNASCKTKV